MITCAYTHFSVYMDVTKGLLPLFRHNAPCCHQALLAIWYFSTPTEQSSVPIFAGSQRIDIAPSRWLVLTKWEKLGWVQTSNNRLQVKSICGEPKLQVIRSVFHLGDLLTSNVIIIWKNEGLHIFPHHPASKVRESRLVRRRCYLARLHSRPQVS